MKHKVYTDGASKGNPGKSGIGVAIYEDNVLIDIFCKFLGTKTNNEAEYLAIIKALERLDELNVNEADFFSDSQLLVRQLNGSYKVKADTIIPLYEAVKFLLKNKKITFTWIEREKNKLADSLANKAIEEHNNL